ncbi:GNAT family N-acetyltransferase [Terricaulis sp.]|uniref:GNAT family N-acetyltransferase n=1 Tax=Terricaulis sp. TaxID=2768686 RepID=UPI003783DF62
MTPTLAGARIVLRPLLMADAKALFVALSDPEVQRYRKDAPHADVAETRAYIEKSHAAGLAWAITEDGGEALGRLALRVNGRSGEFGIVLRRSAHRRGLALKALTLAEAYASDTLGLTRLTANIDAENAASIGLFERAGFAHDAPRRRVSHLGARDEVVLTKSRA